MQMGLEILMQVSMGQISYTNHYFVPGLFKGRARVRIIQCSIKVTRS